MIRVILASSDLLTPCDLRGHTFKVTLVMISGTADNFRFRPDLMVEPIESPKKFNMKKVTILDDEEANKSRKSRLKQQRKEDRDEHNDDSEDSGTDFSIFDHLSDIFGYLYRTICPVI